jgi:hypothetical protein
MSIGGYVVVVQRLHSDAYGLGAGPKPRLPVIPSPAQWGHGAVRVQHVGSIKTATAPRSGGQTIERPRACCVRDAHATAGWWASARMCPSRSP